MTTAQVVETSVTVTNSSSQNYTNPDDTLDKLPKVSIVSNIHNSKNLLFPINC